MAANARLLLLLLVAGLCAAQQERSISSGPRRRNRLPAGKSEVLDFSCPEDFGYYQHPTDCTQYYVCVFGGALQESCSGGLVYSHDLQTCDWPRNVVCNVDLSAPVSTVRVTDPRTAAPPSTRSNLTPSVSSNGFADTLRTSGGRKEQLSGPSSNSVNRQGRIISSNDRPQQDVRGRFQLQESTNRAFSVSPTTTSRTFSFPPALPGAESSSSFKNQFDSRPQSSQSFSSPQKQQSPAATPAPSALDDNFYSDLLNLTDAEYFYLYEDLLLEDYFDGSAGSTTPKPTTRAPIRDRESFSPIRGTDRSAPSSSRSTLSSRSNIVSSNALTDNRASLRENLPQTNSIANTFTSSQTKSNNVDRSRSSTPNRGPPRGSQSRSQSSTSSPRQSNQRSSGSSGSSSAKVDSSRPSRLTLQPVSQIVKSNNQQVTNIWKYPPRRPAPQYPQPTYNTLATKCDRKACRLPDCSCGGKEVPGGLAPQDVPQMVLLTFDDSVNDLNKELYQDLFERGRTNPNGCPLAATFYISHEWTDYSQVQNLYADGHEIASHSITHSFGEQFSKLKWAKEIAGQREIMAAYGGVRMEDVRGMRAPFLAVGGNKMFEMLYEQNFTYDSSMPVYENRPPSYPYTLDYKLFHDCMIPPCPTNSFPGLWEVPMVMWQDLNGGRCSMGDACTTPPDAEGVYKMLIKNFERHYTTNRAPMGLFYHAAWFTTPHHKEGFIAFLDTISGMQDVWLVTNWQALQWMRDPVPISQANNFKPFQCSYPERPARCKSHRVCNVWHKGGVRYMRTCQPCPEAYPWVGSTGVPSPLNDA